MSQKFYEIMLSHMHRFYDKTYGYSKSLRFLKNFKIPMVCRTNTTLLKAVIQKMLFLFYCLIIILEIAILKLIFSIIAYVFVSSIVPKYIRIRLFSQITHPSNVKKYIETHTLFK